MISAMSAVAVRRGRKNSKTLGRWGAGGPPSHHSSNLSLSKRLAHGRVALRPRRRYDSDLDRQRRRFLIYMGTLFLFTGLLLLFIGVGASVPTAQTVGLLLIGVGAVLCIIKVFCSEAHATEVSRKVVAVEDVESGEGKSKKEEEEAAAATPLADIEEFSELQAENQEQNASQQNSLSPTSPPNSIPETQVLIANNDKEARY